MWNTLVGAIAALAGVGLASLTQLLTDRRARAAQHRQQVATLVGALLAAVTRYRELYWLGIAAIRHGEPESAPDRAARYRARSAVTEARDNLALAVNDAELIAAAEAAAWAAIELADIKLGRVGAEGRFDEAVETALSTERERTRNAHSALRRAAAAYIHRDAGSARGSAVRAARALRPGDPR
ncbi:hypothetical protein [Actinomadura yumaensis]|uniref:Uncharacterized protein n=1 Tax=Actinomadura yumaensis TaxID=111807 RepID=A0ABW2CP82_9ACTN